MYIHVTITLVWNEYSISVELIIRILLIYVPLGEMQMRLISIFKTWIKIFSFFLDERCASAVCLMCWQESVAEHTLLQCEGEFFKSQFTSQPSPQECPSPVLPWKLLLLPEEQKSLRDKAKKGYWLIFIFLSLSGTQRRFFFFETSLLFIGVLELRVPLSMLRPALPSGVWRKSPEDMIWNCRTCFSLSFLVQREHIWYLAKSSPACKSEREDSLLCCKHDVHGKASGGDVANLEIC